jgi:hypothetical protein
MRASFLVLASLLLGCPKSDASGDAAPVTSVTATPVVSNAMLAPIDDTPTAAPSTTTPPMDIAPHATATGTAPKPLGTGTGTATGAPTTTAAAGAGATKFRACCNALRKQAQQQPAQAAQLTQAAGMCDGLVAAMGNAGGAPQLEQLGPLLQGVQLPSVCQK